MNTSAPAEMNHPSDQELAAYVDGHGDDASRRPIVEHLAACDECYAVFQSATEFAEHEAAPAGVVVRPGFGRNRLTAAAGVLAVAAMAVIVSMPMIRGWYVERALFAASAERSTRVTDARLSADQAYQEPAVVYRGGPGDDETLVEDTAVQGRAGRLMEAAEDNPSAANLHRAGVAALLIRDPERAVGYLEQARRKGVDDVELWNAMSAAYQMLGARSGQTTARTRALAAAERAWAIEKTPVTAWNRALALETAESPAAAAAWQEYLRLDSDSPWAKEARERFVRAD